MKNIKVAASSLNQTPRDWKGNINNIRIAIMEAKKNDVHILCLPELCITGYGMEDDLFCANVMRRAMKYLLDDICPMTLGITVSVGLPIIINNAIYNGVATLSNGFILGITCKQHLAGDGIHYEPRHFKPWPKNVVIIDKGIPIGDLYFDIGGVKIGYEICEDAWVANRPGADLSKKGIDIILNPSASHFAFGKLETRQNFVVEGSRAFGVTYVYSNLVGNESGRVIFDGGAMVASGGKLLAIGKRFSFKNVELTIVTVDIDNTRTSQMRTASFEPQLLQYDPMQSTRFRIQNDHVSSPYLDNSSRTEVQCIDNTNGFLVDAWELSDVKHEECTRAIGLGLLDYMRKSKTRGFVISLSGGSDSALVTYICVTAIKLAILQLGIDEFIIKYCPWSKSKSVKDIIAELITTAYQSTSNSGNVTKIAANELAKELGVTHFNLDLDGIFKEYCGIGSYIKNSDLQYTSDPITLQNIQARVRSPSIWIIANLQNKLLLTTSNMSEAALGYATMDGDTSGCIAPIAGLPKVYIREYLLWAQNVGPCGIEKCNSLKLVNNQQPTAELMPESYNQTDENDLMPYWLLHEIEVMVVNNRYVPMEIYQYLKCKYPSYSNNRLIDDIKKFFQLFSRNQWKRERCALSFHLDKHNLDPRSWCRTPILTGGYEEELSELDACYVNA